MAKVVLLADVLDAGVSRLLSALKQAGHQVHVVTVEKIAPATIARVKPRAVVFNVGQFVNAYQVLSALRKRQDLKDAVMIGIFGEEESSPTTPPEDFDHRLGEPVDLDALLSAIDSPRRVTHRVLLVEDHAPLAEATAFLMRIEGLEVWIAATGREALEMVDKVRPEIVLCDLRLPDMAGLDIVRELRAHPGAKDALIAIHTGMDERTLDTLKADSDAFVDMYLSKPLTPEKLDALISGLGGELPAARGGSRRK